jgi:hypothetical protein
MSRRYLHQVLVIVRFTKLSKWLYTFNAGIKPAAWREFLLGIFFPEPCVHFVNIWVENQQIQQLFIQFIN